MKRHSTLERRMLTYFVLIAAASLLITMEFVWAIGSAMPSESGLVPAVSPAQTLEHVTQAMRSLQSKALIMFMVQAIETLIMLVMFIRKITTPLREIVEEADFIARGDLSRTIPVRVRDEIGLVGETINSLTSNIQEMTALGLWTEASLREPLVDLRRRVGIDPESRKLIDDMESKLDKFRNLAEDLKLLPPPVISEEEAVS